MQADLFHKPDGHYFLSHSIGLLPRGVEAALDADFFSLWRGGSAACWPHWLDAIDTFRERLGHLVGADKEMICPQTNLSSALTKILFSLPPAPDRNVILLTEQDFPTMGFVMRQAEKAGWRLKFLPRDTDLTDPQVWLDAMTDDTGIVHATCVYSNSSMRAPVKEITAAAKAQGILSIIDIAQAAGAVPLCVRDWDADFVLGSCVKYLCGGPGAGYLISNPETIKNFEPVDVGWFSHQNPFGMDIHDFQYAEDASRFWGGTPSVLPFVTAAHGIGTLLEAGPERYQAGTQALQQQIIDALDPALIHSETDPAKRGRGLLYAPPDGEAVTARLKEANIQHDLRRGAIRLSVHLYNSQEDVRALLDALQG